MTSYDRFTFGIPCLYLGLDLAVTLIGLFALVEIIGKAELKRNELNLHAGKSAMMTAKSQKMNTSGCSDQC